MKVLAFRIKSTQVHDHSKVIFLTLQIQKNRLIFKILQDG